MLTKLKFNLAKQTEVASLCQITNQDKARLVSFEILIDVISLCNYKRQTSLTTTENRKLVFTSIY